MFTLTIGAFANGGDALAWSGEPAETQSFVLYALDTPTLGIPEGVHRKELEHAIKRHKLGIAEYMGRFERI
jgi:phosphatidylethanolamine-binding protein (PEBP) family uncharacterized protein